MKIHSFTRFNVCRMKGTCVETGSSFRRGIDSYPCFYAAFRFMNEHSCKTYDINYDLYILKEYDGYRNNFAVISKTDMCRLLNSVKYIIPFTFSFTDEVENESKEAAYVLHMHLKGTALQHKALLMLSRMLFEYPHNICAKDALSIRTFGKLGDKDISAMSLINLYILCLSSVSYFSKDESIISNVCPTLMEMDALRNKLKIKRRKLISAVIPQKTYRVKLWQRNHYVDSDDFDRDDLIKERLSTYINNLKRNLNAQKNLLSKIFNGYRIQMD